MALTDFDFEEFDQIASRPESDRPTIVNKASGRLGVPTQWVDNIINFESLGGDPQAVNPNSGAGGLIQFTNTTSKQFGYADAQDLISKNPTFGSQMWNVVVPYLQQFKPQTEEDFYLSVFYPAAMGKDLDQELPKNVQELNPGIRTPRDYVNLVRSRGGGAPKEPPVPQLSDSDMASFDQIAFGGGPEEAPVQPAPPAQEQVVHTMPDGTTMAGPEHPGAVPDSERLEAGEISQADIEKFGLTPPTTVAATTSVEQPEAFPLPEEAPARAIGETLAMPGEEREGIGETKGAVVPPLPSTPLVATAVGAFKTLPVVGHMLEDRQDVEDIEEQHRGSVVAGELAGHVVQTVAGTAAISAIPKVKALVESVKLIKNPIVRKAAQTAIMGAQRAAGSALATGTNNVEDVLRNKKTLGEAISNTAETSLAHFASALPEGFLPLNAIQLLAQPATDILFNFVWDKATGREYADEEVINIAGVDVPKRYVWEGLASLGFATMDINGNIEPTPNFKKQIAKLAKKPGITVGEPIKQPPIVRPEPLTGQARLDAIAKEEAGIPQEFPLVPTEAEVVPPRQLPAPETGKIPEKTEPVPVGATEPIKATLEPEAVQPTPKPVVEQPEAIKTVRIEDQPPVPPKEPPKPPPPPKKPVAEAKPPDGAKEKERSFPKTAEKRGVVGGIDRLFEPETAAKMEKDADRILTQRGVTGAERFVAEETDPGASHMAVAAKLIEINQKKAIALNKAGKKKQADEAFLKAVDIASVTAERATRLGQEIKAIDLMIPTMSPEGSLVKLQSNVEKLNRGRPENQRIKITAQEAQKVTGLAKQVQKVTELSDSAKKAQEIAGRLTKNKPLTEDDVAYLRSYSDLLGKETAAPTVTSEPGVKVKKPKAPSVADTVKERLLNTGNAALDRFNARHKKGPRLQAGLPLDDMTDLSIYGASRIAAGAIDFGKWSAEMVSAFGDEIKPHLKAVWKRARGAFDSETRRVKAMRAEKRLIDNTLKSLDANKQVAPEELESLHKIAGRVKNLTGEAKTEAVYELQQALRDHSSPGVLQKIATTQTIAQLLNLKTIGRNLLGNEMFWRMERLSKYASVPFDIVASKITGERTTTFKTGGQKGWWGGLITGSRRAWKGLNVDDFATKYDLQGNTFKSKYNPLTYMEKILGVTLRGTDFASYNRAKNQTLGELGEIAAINQKIPAKDRKKFVQDFVEHADDSALKLADEYGKYATFQDQNLLSNTLVGAKKLMNAHKKFGVGDLLLKYPKTPANIMMRAIDYSPAGFVKGMYHLSKAAFGSFDQRSFSLSMGRALVGTAGFTGLGYLLYDMGVITGSPEDFKVRRFKREQTGAGPYRLNVSAVKRWLGNPLEKDRLKKRKGDTLVSYDWAQPLAISLTMGANIAAKMNETDLSGNKTDILGGFIDSFAGGANALAEQPLLTGIQTAFGTNAPAGERGEQAIKAFTRTAESAPASFFPTLLYQVRQATDNTARETHDPNPLKKSLNKVINKMPFVEKILPPTYNTFGLDKKTIAQHGQNTLFNVFLNPAFVSKYEVDPLVEMALEPFERELRRKQIPRVAPRKLRVSKKNIMKAYGVSETSANLILKRAGLKKERDRFVIEFEGKQIQEMQKIMAAETTRGFAKEIGRLRGKSPEEQEKALAKRVNAAAEVARLKMIKRTITSAIRKQQKK